jgi:hypothetical protein
MPGERSVGIVSNAQLGEIPSYLWCGGVTAREVPDIVGPGVANLVLSSGTWTGVYPYNKRYQGTRIQE